MVSQGLVLGCHLCSQIYTKNLSCQLVLQMTATFLDNHLQASPDLSLSRIVKTSLEWGKHSEVFLPHTGFLAISTLLFVMEGLEGFLQDTCNFHLETKAQILSVFKSLHTFGLQEIFRREGHKQVLKKYLKKIS